MCSENSNGRKSHPPGYVHRGFHLRRPKSLIIRRKTPAKENEIVRMKYDYAYPWVNQENASGRRKSILYSFLPLTNVYPLPSGYTIIVVHNAEKLSYYTISSRAKCWLLIPSPWVVVKSSMFTLLPTAPIAITDLAKRADLYHYSCTTSKYAPSKK